MKVVKSFKQNQPKVLSLIVVNELKELEFVHLVNISSIKITPI